jgi:hypothetical protein
MIFGKDRSWPGASREHLLTGLCNPHEGNLYWMAASHHALDLRGGEPVAYQRDHLFDLEAMRGRGLPHYSQPDRRRAIQVRAGEWQAGCACGCVWASVTSVTPLTYHRTGNATATQLLPNSVIRAVTAWDERAA